MRLASMVALLLLGAAPVPIADLVLRGGTIYPGGSAPFVGDVAVAGDRIVAVGRRLGRARRTIDARGMIVAPGFIDPHTHADAYLASSDSRQRLVLAFLQQGVTTAVIGNDGTGSADVAAVFARARRLPAGINVAAHVGFGTVRKAVIGEARRAPTAAELARMRGLVAQAMCQGAVGLSAGLFYAPQSFAETAEVAALAGEAARRGGFYDTHLRDEAGYSVGLAAAVDEALAIGRASGAPVHISHIKALGVDAQGSAPAIIARIRAARRAGQQVTADQYPWDASGTSLAAALVPAWALDGGRAAMLSRLDQTRVRAGMADNLRRRGGPARLLITEGNGRGRTLADVARRGDPVAAAVALLRVADPAAVSFNQIEPDITAFMAEPWVMTGSDASAGHPRVFGSYARKYRRYVVEHRVLTLRQFVDRSTANVADLLGLADRGRLRVGAFADVVVFDPRRFAERATYARPTLPAVGMRTVVVNGTIAIDDGRPTGRAAGRGLAHLPTPGSCR